MAVFAFTDAYFVFNSVNLSDHVKSITLTTDVAVLDSTAMGTSGYVSNIGGLKSFNIAVTFNDDLAASNVDVTLWPLLGTSVAFELRATSSAVGATNPKWTGNVLMNQHMIGGSVGDLAGKTLTFPGTGAVTRATA